MRHLHRRDLHLGRRYRRGNSSGGVDVRAVHRGSAPGHRVGAGGVPSAQRSHIGTEHLLLGLSQGGHSTHDALRDAGFDAASAHQQLEAATPAPSGVTSGHIPFTPRAKRTLEESLHVAERLGQAHIAPPHLLRALLGMRDGAGVKLLVALGLDVTALAVRMEELAATSEPGTGPGARAVRATAYLGSPQAHCARSVIQERDRLRSALVRYARHEGGCDPGQGCNCGLAQVLAGDVEDEGA